MYAKIKAVKSSVCPPTHEVTLPIRFSTGLDDDLALLDFFLEPGRKIDPNPVSSAGAWLKTVVPGQEKPISFQYGSWNKTLAEHPELRDHLRKEVMRHLRG